MDAEQAILQALDRNPDLAPLLTRALEADGQYQGQEDWKGWTWNELPGDPITLSRLVARGVLRIGFKSHRTTTYRVADPEALAIALAAFQPAGPSHRAEPEGIPADLFDVVEGHEREKQILRWAIEAERPLHALLLGEVGTAKTLLLSELARLPNARYALGGTTSKAGLVSFLLAERPRYLIIDELDDADGRDLDTLKSVMEGGVVSRLQYGRTELERLLVWVFAGANRLRRLSAALRSRFLPLRFPPYTDEEFRRVAVGVLVKREGQDPELAREIVTLLQGRTRDVRDAVKAARLAQGDRRRLPLLAHLFPAE